jgi:hypothetical protein
MKAIYLKDFPTFTTLTFESLSICNILKSLEKTSYECIEFSNFEDLMSKTLKIFNSKGIEVETCFYSDSYFIQTINIDVRTNEKLYVKRKVRENEDYTFCVKTFEFLDLTIDDIAMYIRQKYIHKGLHITNEVKDIEFLTVFSKDEIIDKLFINENNIVKEIPFINIATIYNRYNGNVEKAQNYINEFKNNAMVQFSFSQYNFNFCIFDCFFEINGNYTNDIMTSFLNNHVSGEFFIGMTDMNYNNQQIDINKDTFDKIIKAKKSSNFIKRANKIIGNEYYNIFFELNHLS